MENSIIKTARKSGQFNTLLTAVERASLESTLEEDGPFTLFAPTDDAFAALPEGTIKELLDNPAQLTDVLTYHVVPGRLSAKDVSGRASAATVQGSELAFDSTDGVKVGEAHVLQADVAASNGVIHVIDRVLIPAA